MFIRTSLLTASLLLASCGGGYTPSAEERAFVARFDDYCGTHGGGPLGDRTCNAYLVMMDGRIYLLSGINSVGDPIVSGRNWRNDVVGGEWLPENFSEDRVARIIGPGEEGYDAANALYLTQIPVPAQP